MAFATAADALEALEVSRADLIEAGRNIAFELCRDHGTTHAREVAKVMEDRGYPIRRVDGRWMGAVFSRKHFIFTGERYMPGDTEYKSDVSVTHVGDPIRVWRMKQEAA